MHACQALVHVSTLVRKGASCSSSTSRLGGIRRRREGVAALHGLRGSRGEGGLMRMGARCSVRRRIDEILRDHALEPRRQLLVQLHHLRDAWLLNCMHVAARHKLEGEPCASMPGSTQAG